MKTPYASRSHFIYEVDNIPDHRSRRFGCSASQMAISPVATHPKKKPHESCNSHTANAK